ncbi:MAG: NADH-quinone oxidoreductase subunit NuoE [Thermincolia bacterium]
MAICQCGNSLDDSKQQQLDAVFTRYSGQKGALIPVLQEAQNIYGYLPEEVLEQISKNLKIPFSKVYGVVTFYAQFHLKPRGRNIIRVCLGTACHVRGGAKIFDRIRKELSLDDGETTLDLRYTLESVACIGACGLAPVIMVNDDTHGRLMPDQIADILVKYE